MSTSVPHARMTTLCVGRVCVGYRSLDETSLLSEYAAIATVFSVTFIAVWVFVMVLLLLCETVHSLSQIGRLARGTGSASGYNDERATVGRELAQIYGALDEASPLSVVDGFEPMKCGGGCAVCLETVGTGQVGRRLGCGHWFHARCIDRWILQSAGMKGSEGGGRCPLCKAPVVVRKKCGSEDERTVALDLVVSGHSGYDVVHDERMPSAA